MFSHQFYTELAFCFLKSFLWYAYNFLIFQQHLPAVWVLFLKFRINKPNLLLLFLFFSLLSFPLSFLLPFLSPFFSLFGSPLFILFFAPFVILFLMETGSYANKVNSNEHLFWSLPTLHVPILCVKQGGKREWEGPLFYFNLLCGPPWWFGRMVHVFRGLDFTGKDELSKRSQAAKAMVVFKNGCSVKNGNMGGVAEFQEKVVIPFTPACTLMLTT